MKVLVTGSNGFVGSHIVETLIDQGHEIVCLVRKTSDLTNLSSCSVEYRYHDVRDESAHPDIVADVDAIIHNAGIVRACKPEDYYRVNRDSVRFMVNAVNRFNPKLKKFILISSQAAMGPSINGLPKLLTEPETPISNYGKSKLAGEKELKNLIGTVPYTILRPTSVYGPRDKDFLMFFRMVRYGFRLMPLKERFLQLVYVKDLANAAASSLENAGSDNKTFVVASQSVYSWEDICKIIAKSLNKITIPLPAPDFLFYGAGFAGDLLSKLSSKPPLLNTEKAREIMQRFWVADTSNATKSLSIDFTNFEIGAKMTYLWYQKNHWL